MDIWQKQPAKISDEAVCQQTQIDWEQRRYEIARDALTALLSVPTIGAICAPCSKAAVTYADSLIKELKKK